MNDRQRWRGATICAVVALLAELVVVAAGARTWLTYALVLTFAVLTVRSATLWRRARSASK